MPPSTGCAAASASRARASASRARASASRTRSPASRVSRSDASSAARSRTRASCSGGRDPAPLERHVAASAVGLGLAHPGAVHLDPPEGGVRLPVRGIGRQDPLPGLTRLRHAGRARRPSGRARPSPRRRPARALRRARGRPRGSERPSTTFSTRAMDKVTRPGPVSTTIASRVLSTTTPLTRPPLRRRISSEDAVAAARPAVTRPIAARRLSPLMGPSCSDYALHSRLDSKHRTGPGRP